MFKRILVPVDPAKPLAAANDFACQLAQRFGSTLIANYILDEELSRGAGEAVGALDMAMEFVGRDAMDAFALHHPDLSVEKRLSYGHTATVIFQSVLGTGADLVVVGGYRTLSPKMLGSTVVEIVHHDEKPTFVVRRRAHLPRPGESIVVPFDASERAVENLARICAFAKELDCGIELVYVARRKEAERGLHALERGRIQVEGLGVPVKTTCLERGMLGSKGRSILKHAHDVDAPLVAISRLGESSMFTGHSRTVAWLLTHSDLPVWVVRK